MSKTNPLLTSRRRVTVPLYSGEVETRLQELDEALEVAYANESAGSMRATSVSEADAIAKERDDYAAKAQAEAPKLVLEGITERQLQRLRDEHPPRKGDKLDETVGYNREDFPAAFIRACLVEPEVTDEQWDEFIEQASSGRLHTLLQHANEVTGDDVDLPKSSAVSALTRLRERAQRPLGGLV